MRFAPATTVAGADFTTERSADAVTLVDTVDVLFTRLGSAVAEVTVAEFESVAPCAGPVTTTVIVGAVAPDARVGRVQDTETLPVLVHAQPVPVAETKVTPAGKVSPTLSVLASDGPMFWTTRL